MHWYDDAMRVIGVPEDLVAALGAVQLPATPLKRSSCFAWRYGRQPRRHTLTVTRSISIGLGIGSPCASSDSR
jgi:hypothetical protein